MRFLMHTLAVTTLVALPVGSAAAAEILINNVDAPGVGFNDPRPAAPVPGNPGTTIGAQRLATFERAAELWGAALPHDVDIVIQATFQPLPCDASSAVLGSAGTIQIFTEFTD